MPWTGHEGTATGQEGEPGHPPPALQVAVDSSHVQGTGWGLQDRVGHQHQGRARRGMVMEQGPWQMQWLEVRVPPTPSYTQWSMGPCQSHLTPA